MAKGVVRNPLIVVTFQLDKLKNEPVLFCQFEDLDEHLITELLKVVRRYSLQIALSEKGNLLHDDFYHRHRNISRAQKILSIHWEPSGTLLSVAHDVANFHPYPVYFLSRDMSRLENVSLNIKLTVQFMKQITDHVSYGLISSNAAAAYIKQSLIVPSTKLQGKWALHQTVEGSTV